MDHRAEEQRTTGAARVPNDRKPHPSVIAMASASQSDESMARMRAEQEAAIAANAGQWRAEADAANAAAGALDASEREGFHQEQALRKRDEHASATAEQTATEPSKRAFDTAKEKPSLDRLISLPVSKYKDAAFVLPLVTPEACDDCNTSGEYVLHRVLEYDDVPDEVVLAVLDACPAIATVATTAGSLPLHAAARRASLAVFREVFIANRQAAAHALPSGHYPLHIVCEHNGKEDGLAPMVGPLVAACPAATSVRLDSRFGSVYPLHLACMWQCSFDVVVALLD